ncbi:MAG: cupin domain-containing protein [Pseudomonadota bacterium]
MAEQSLLGDLAPEVFLSDYWQQQPLLIRDAAPNWHSPLTPEELAGLALEEEVESRLITHKNNQWALRHGPFVEADFTGMPPQDWTLLVQAVDLWVDEVAQLKARVDFLPAWRLDDIMVSFATTGGGVGPHFDHYDVFLLQVEGEREWQLGERCDVDEQLREDGDLHLLDRFEASAKYVLRPGDALYLPPRYAHWGTALTDGLTYSIGFRAPTLSEMLDDLVMELQSQNREAYLRDPPLSPTMASDAIDPAFVEQAQAMFRELIADDAFFADWLARYMTIPKYPHYAHLTDERRHATVAGRRYVNGEPEED